MSTSLTQPAGPLLTEVLAWCADHPWTGGDLSVGDLTCQQHYDAETNTRTVSVLGAPPQVMAVSVDLLEQADPQFLKFDRGLLAINVLPERMLYEPLYVGWRAELVVFRRVCTRCHNSRKVPDWGNWNEEYGEPRPKPCPVCAEWPR